MNPGLVVKLRPAGPWRIGPDSGARNRVDAIYHSDSLYSAVTGAMARLESLDPWLDATARNGVPAVCFSSCFPFLEEIGFVVPPRTVWPPTSPALLSARVRWKSARFVPLGVVQALVSGRRLDESHWNVDGPSECLVPAGRPGPFRTGVRWNAAVDRLTGSTERHSTACIEFRPGAGLWTVVSFAGDAARDRWLDPLKACFRLLADSGFGGERSRGWGRSEQPEFVEGTLPDMILGGQEKGEAEPGAGGRGTEPSARVGSAEPRLPLTAKPSIPSEPEQPEPSAHAEAPLASGPEPSAPEPGPQAEPATEAEASPAPVPEPPASEPSVEAEPLAQAEASPSPVPEPPTPEPSAESEPSAQAEAALVVGPQPATLEAEPAAEGEPPPAPGPQPPAPKPATTPGAHWMLSLFAPAAADSVDWRRGNYAVVERGGRVESPAGSGELKKQLRMVAEGSVLYAASAPRGSAADVAPEGFAHPVFRAGFALSIPLPEVS